MFPKEYLIFHLSHFQDNLSGQIVYGFLEIVDPHLGMSGHTSQKHAKSYARLSFFFSWIFGTKYSRMVQVKRLSSTNFNYTTNLVHSWTLCPIYLCAKNEYDLLITFWNLEDTIIMVVNNTKTMEAFKTPPVGLKCPRRLLCAIFNIN